MSLFSKLLRISVVSLAFIGLLASSVQGQDTNTTQSQGSGSSKTWVFDCQPGTQEREFPFDTAFVKIDSSNCACGETEEDARNFVLALMRDYQKTGEFAADGKISYQGLTMAFSGDKDSAEQTLYCYDLLALKDMMRLAQPDTADDSDFSAFDNF